MGKDLIEANRIGRSVPGVGAILLMLGLVLPSLAAARVQKTTPAPPARSAPATIPIPRPGAPESFSGLAARLLPAVVNISARAAIDDSELTERFAPGSALERFNDLFGRGEKGPVSSLGSGFVIDPTGLIVTNNHVVEKGESFEIAFSDGQTLPARLLGTDPATDIAVLKVAARGPLPFVRWGDSKGLKVGDWVLAIGNPFGLGGSVSAGIVSARNRDISTGRFDDFIQTDAAINKGNSGGPLFNLAGDVVGVNTAIFSPTGGSVGIGFAAPSDLVSSIARQLAEKGEVRRGFLGVATQGVDAELAQGLRLSNAGGAVITEVSPNGPASKAGLRVGDVILRFDGQAVSDTRSLTRLSAEAPIGKKVAIDYIRAGKLARSEAVIALYVDPASRPKTAPKAVAAVSNAASAGAALGLGFADLNAGARRQYQIPAHVEGALVQAVDPRSDAAAKVKIGDVVVEIGFQRVANAAAAQKQAIEAAKPGKPVAIYLSRGGEAQFVAVRPKGK